MTNFLIKHFIPNASDVKSPAVRQRYGVVSGVVGILCNALLCTAKIAAGLLTGAVSIVADGINNLSDGGSCVVSLLGFKMAGKPADDKHPFGHGRIEYVAGLIVSFIIVLMGVELAKTSLDKIFHPEEISFSWITPAVLGISILVKLWMCFFNRKMGDKIDSAVLRATAMDSLSDVAATSAVLAGFAIGYWARVNLDGYLGVLVALFIYRRFHRQRNLRPAAGRGSRSGVCQADPAGGAVLSGNHRRARFDRSQLRSRPQRCLPPRRGSLRRGYPKDP